jgi:trehalose 6-phosphate phosphatase
MLCVFDFDGTLSPIVAHPDDACLPPEVLERLLTLSRQVALAILTGRSLADIRPRLGFEPHYLVGNHGLEGVPGWDWRAEQYAQACRAWKKILEPVLRDQSRFDPGILLEDKKYSLSLHYRMARDQRLAQARLAELIAGLHPAPRVIAGKCVFSLLPQYGVDKGSALQQLMQQSGARSALYAGDDVTDEDVFKLKRPDLLTVRIEHAPDSAAEFFLPRRQDILQLLNELIARLCNTHGFAAAPPVSAGNA